MFNSIFDITLIFNFFANGERRISRVPKVKAIKHDADSEPEYGILNIQQQKKHSTVQNCSLELLKSNRGTPRVLSFIIRLGAKSIYAAVDTGSSVSFMNKGTAHILLCQNPKSLFTNNQNLPNDVFHSARLSIPISSGGLKYPNANFLVWKNRTRCLLGLDLQGLLVVDTIQRNPPDVNTVRNVVENSSELIKAHL